MMTHRLMRLIIICSLTLLLLCKISGAAEQTPEVRQAISAGLDYLKKYNYSFKPVSGLVAYTLLVGDVPPETPAVDQGIDIILEKFRLNPLDYNPLEHHLYEAAIDVMALEKADAVKYKPEIEAIVQYVLSAQQDHGGWFYPAITGKYRGDTSITQYAILALWAGYRAGVEIPQQTLIKAAQWHLETQQADGGFGYQPTTPRSRTTGTMAAAGCGSLGIISLMLYGNAADSGQQNQPRLKFGILEKVNRSGNQITGASALQVRPQVKKALSSVEGWLSGRYPAEAVAPHDGFQYYFFYTIERATAVNRWEKLGSHDWYEIGTKVLLPKQGATGGWPEATSQAKYAPSGTCFALLFLMRATKKLVPPVRIVDPIGDGLLTGGRGLPDNLQNLEIQDGKVSSGPLLGSLDQLLNGLNQVTIDGDNGNQQPEMKVDLNQPEKLVGQLELLGTLSQHQDERVRQIAAWAFGKSDQIEGAGWLIPLLLDDNMDVAVEARYALCRIARRPTGWGHLPDPRIDVNLPDRFISPEELKQWQQNIHRDWTTWYRKLRPYEIRDDLNDPEQQLFQKRKP